MSDSLVHGTYAGWNKHQRRGEPPCSACRQAQTDYMRARRASSPVARRKDRDWNRQRRAALEQLAMEYPGRFVEILADIRERER